MLSERRRAVRPAACVIQSQRGAGRFKGLSSGVVVLAVLGVPWLEDAHPVAAHSAPDENPLLSMRGADVAREDPHVAAEASKFLEDGISRQQNTRRCLPMRRRRRGFHVGYATHVLNITETCEPFVLSGCAELNDPPQRCWIGFQVDRSILR
ncbi:hypothetical protein Tc00.1047053508999.49 [Trypanosoma cruzi]|uniref:Uncharacterized protein n=1 Tax=Trypanosoma cruzi (strain CL Brener) TaxID=353153 RepID=Q4E0E8_TRYCC|nr:hypothetical protein Tc00.1047053508999.49 [Trypanosoma cruzi]EAN98252.1 hypothetical protein Tc00.1047053508999.49 [Trypanosoma cruzi]|eukprot:XP_820103.1 hypothetical protein [Trypanosoma cruzi strain CL Brener]